MSALCHANNWSAALELFNMAQEDPKAVEQPYALGSGLIALSTALNKAGATVDMLNIVHFMLEYWIKVRLSCYSSSGISPQCSKLSFWSPNITIVMVMRYSLQHDTTKTSPNILYSMSFMLHFVCYKFLHAVRCSF